MATATGVKHVQIGRRYAATTWVRFVDVAAQEFDENDIKAKTKQLIPAVKAAADALGEASKEKLCAAADAFEDAAIVLTDRVKWASNAVAGVQNLRKALAAADAELSAVRFTSPNYWKAALQ